MNDEIYGKFHMKGDKMTEIDHECTTNIVCPYCGKEEYDLWELTRTMSDGDESKTFCNTCGEEFSFEISVDVTYTSWKKGESND